MQLKHHDGFIVEYERRLHTSRAFPALSEPWKKMKCPNNFVLVLVRSLVVRGVGDYSFW